MPIKSRFFATVITAGALLVGTGGAHAAPILQYASSVIGFSSQYSTTNWSAQQVLGAPNTPNYGDIQSAWAPGPRNGSLEWISVGFGTAVYATGATIRESSGNGFVYRVDLIDTLGALHTVWSGVDNSAPNVLADFSLSWAQTPYLVSGLKVYTNTDHNPSTWEEIDAIQLAGSTVPANVPEPGTMVLLGMGLLGVAASRRKLGQRKPR
jgi:hypothetical protein